MKKNLGVLVTTLTIVFFLSAICYIAAAKRNSISVLSITPLFQKQPKEAPEYLPGRFTTIIDEQENILSMMSRAVYIGDELYTAEGRIYRLEKVQGDRASARFLGIDPQIMAYNEYYTYQDVPVVKKKNEYKPASPANFAIYHTHSDESYVPSEGASSISFKGGIYQVGRIMAERLRKAGMEVNYDETPHDPHDNNAYVRSRRTAAKLLSTNPVAMFDVHRDGVTDPSFYRANVSGKDVATIRLVVGRENPRMSANLDFAKQMLTAVNNIHPKVVKEIFVGKGDYNQDLSPTALLIEAGTYTNTREEAERGVDLFSEALPTVMGISSASPAPNGPSAPGKSTGAARGSWKALGWLLGLTVFAGLAFLLISDGKLSNAKKRLVDFGREIIPFGPRRAARKPDENNRNNNE